MLKIVAIYFATVMAVGAVNFQYRNASKGNYVALALTSCVMGSLNLFMLKTIPHVEHFEEGLAYILGGASGAVLGTFFHKKFFKNE